LPTIRTSHGITVEISGGNLELGGLIFGLILLRSPAFIGRRINSATGHVRRSGV
jgi:hypothetical protein